MFAIGNKPWVRMVVVLAVSTAGGCAHDTSDRNRFGRSDPDRPDWLTAEVPRDAGVVDEGTGDLAFRARRDGRFWVYDMDKRTLDYMGKVEEGDRVEVRPDDNRVLVNDHVVSKRDLKKNSVHRIYYERE